MSLTYVQVQIVSRTTVRKDLKSNRADMEFELSVAPDLMGMPMRVGSPHFSSSYTLQSNSHSHSHSVNEYKYHAESCSSI